MAAQKGNEFWKLRSKHGRDKLFESPDLLWKAACEYFQWCEDNPIEAEDNKGTKNVNVVKFKRPYTIKGFCLYCDASENWFKEYRKAITDKDFLSVIHIIEDIIYNQKFEGAAIGLYNANIIARDLGLADKSDVEQKTVIEYKNVSKQFPEG
jgi:DNA-packaging protein gp3